ncbi:hypothetical protein GCK72_019538 [Caenorhabditis remanei]|uniref:DUF38 domain-containing protein n=2 Tax=Caenorhabditis remanei TaxID=31234 RepID=A0A6A5GE78_CAERE|nr:hypothetical protein GCK72_019538 [Caenorhabditis remanei]KAF1752983.1 hypothetical protein GCK72_019538 [Caenorhabditis remanei]
MVSKTEQWKNATELKAFGYYNYNIPIESLLHFDRLNVQHINRLSTEKAWKFIENFLRRNPALGSCFQVQTMFALDIDGILENFSVSPNNEPTEHEYSTYYKHTQLFELPNPNHICVVKISEHGIYAAVSRITHLEPDFRWYLFGVRIE